MEYEIQEVLTPEETGFEYHYRDHTEALGSSLINLAVRCPSLLQRALIERESVEEESKEIDAYSLGTAWHNRRQHGAENWKENYRVVVPKEFEIADGTKISTKKDAREWLAAQLPTADIVTRKNDEMLERMEELFWRNEVAAAIEGSPYKREQSIKIKYGHWPFWLKCRPDLLSWDHSETNQLCLADYKTTRETTIDGFKRSVKKFGYGISAVLYQTLCLDAGFDVGTMKFIVTSTETGVTWVVDLPADYLRYQSYILRNTLDAVSKRWDTLRTEHWSPVQTEILTLEI